MSCTNAQCLSCTKAQCLSFPRSQCIQKLTVLFCKRTMLGWHREGGEGYTGGGIMLNNTSDVHLAKFKVILDYSDAILHYFDAICCVIQCYLTLRRYYFRGITTLIYATCDKITPHDIPPNGDVTIMNGPGFQGIPILLRNATQKIMQDFTAESQWETWSGIQISLIE